jgi:hypothetical protein
MSFYEMGADEIIRESSSGPTQLPLCAKREHLTRPAWRLFSQNLINEL